MDGAIRSGDVLHSSSPVSGYTSSHCALCMRGTQEDGQLIHGRWSSHVPHVCLILPGPIFTLTLFSVVFLFLIYIQSHYKILFFFFFFFFLSFFSANFDFLIFILFYFIYVHVCILLLLSFTLSDFSGLMQTGYTSFFSFFCFEILDFHQRCTFFGVIVLVFFTLRPCKFLSVFLIMV